VKFQASLFAQGCSRVFVAEWPRIASILEGSIKMKTRLFIVAAMIWLSACASAQVTREKTTDGVFIHITHGTDDPHRVAMALNMAKIMSEDHDVLVYFDIKGIEVALRDAPDISFAQFPSSKTQLTALSNKGVPLLACPGCLQAAGKTAADLAKGVTVAEKAKFFNFTKGRILALDY
jgi:predicted peroxiredoxin